MGIEIERKFLVDKQKWALAAKPAGIHYRQGYILNTGKQTVRVRTDETQGYINLKSAVNHLNRKEFEYPIPLTDAVEMLSEFTPKQIEKIRYKIPFHGKTWEVDEFLGENDGLIVAEIELTSEDETFEKPDWVTIDVTADGRYTNAALSQHPFNLWRPVL